MSKYQLFPDMTEQEFSELKADIAERGVMVPVEFDELGNILDGHHRKKICDELGIKDFPRVIRYGMSEQEKRQHVRKLNLARRHLDKDQRRKIIEQALKEEPQKSNRQHGRELGVDKNTVDSVRKELQESGEIHHFSERIDPRTGNASQPAKKTRTPSIIVHDDKQQRKAESPEIAKADPEQEFRIQRSKTIKTCEALMRAVDDLHRLKPRLDDQDWCMSACKALLQNFKNW